MRTAFGFAALAGSMLLAMPALAQPYPNRIIKIVVPSQPGSGSDFVGRLLSTQLEKRIGQSVIVENKLGAQGTIAVRAVLSAPPDGYTVGLSTMGVHPLLVSTNGVDLIKESTLLTTLNLVPLVVMTAPTLPISTVKDLVAYARANPGKLNYGDTNSIPPNIVMALFAHKLNFPYTTIPYKGGLEASMAVATGESHITLSSMPTAGPMIRAGKVHALMVSTPVRSPLLPDVPTPAEAGAEDFPVLGHVWLLAPLATPADIVRRLNSEVAAIAQIPDYSQKVVAALGSLPIHDSPEEAKRKAQKELDILNEAIRIGAFKPR